VKENQEGANMDKKTMIFVLVIISILSVGAFSYSLQAGYFDNSYGAMISQDFNALYISTGLAANSVAFLMTQRLGLTWQGFKIANVNVSVRGGADASFLLAFNKAKAVLFSAFIESEFEYDNFELTLGIFKGLKAINYSQQIVDFTSWAPEMKVGYRW
jgi:hypothetical protein